MAVLPARLLVDSPNWLGDFVHTLPALAALRSANRSGETTLLLPAAHAPLARLLGVKAIVRPVGAGFEFGRRCLSGKFDVVLTARHSSRAKLLLAATGAEIRLASRGRGATALRLTTFPVLRGLHQRHDLDGALALLGLRAVPTDPYHLQLPDRLKHQGLCQRALLGDLPGMVALLPATRGLENKRYPMRHFVAVARGLAEEGITPVVVVGPGEEGLATRLATETRAQVAPTAWPLHEVAALLAACDAAVGNDSGLTHLAAVVGCPTVALFGPTDPARTAPIGSAVVVRSHAPTCAQRRLDEIAPAEVIGTVRMMMAAQVMASGSAASALGFGVAPENAPRYDRAQRVGR